MEYLLFFLIYKTGNKFDLSHTRLYLALTLVSIINFILIIKKKIRIQLIYSFKSVVVVVCYCS